MVVSPLPKDKLVRLEQLLKADPSIVTTLFGISKLVILLQASKAEAPIDFTWFPIITLSTLRHNSNAYLPIDVTASPITYRLTCLPKMSFKLELVV